MNYHKSIESLLTPLPKHIAVAFAIHCCNDIKHLMNKESLLALELTEKWLANNDSVTSNELYATANAATYAAYAANAAAYAATAATNAARATANATYSAAHAANAANAAAHAAHAAHADNKEAKMKEYYDYLVNYINNLTLLEKELYNLN